MTEPVLNSQSEISAQELAFSPATDVNAYVLTGTAATVTFPTGTTMVNFAASCNFLCNWTTTAAVPGASITDGSSPELNPTTRYVSGLTSCSIINLSANGTVFVSFYKAQSF